MSENKCTSQEASHYINDLFETLEMKGNNQLLFNEFCQLLMKYSLETVKKSWKEIVFSCDLPNGQIAGRLPKMQMIEKILFNNRMDNVDYKHQQTKTEIAPPGTINKLWDWGKEYADGKITKRELEMKIEEYIK